MEIFYQKMLQKIKAINFLPDIIIGLTKIVPLITFIIYPTVLVYLLITKNPLFLDTLIRPALSFIFVTIFRKLINRKRPYETMNIDPLIKHKQGESFPSRHTVSAFAIAFACINVNLCLGTMMIFLALLVSSCRILCGVHYISDVISAIIIAFIIGTVAF